MQVTSEINAAITAAQRFADANAQAQNAHNALGQLRAAAFQFDGFCTPDQKVAIIAAQEAIIEIQNQTGYRAAMEYIKTQID